jgi:hypothetical protein
MTDPVHKMLDSADLAPATKRAYLTDSGEHSRSGATREAGRGCQPIPTRS